MVSVKDAELHFDYVLVFLQVCSVLKLSSRKQWKISVEEYPNVYPNSQNLFKVWKTAFKEIISLNADYI